MRRGEWGRKGYSLVIRQGGAPHIYVVDDRPDFLGLMEDVLSDEGYEVTTFRCGAEVVGATARRRPDLIISDLRLGGESGFDLLRALQSDPVSSDIPILLCTAATLDIEDHKEEPDLNIPVLYKPFEVDDLLTRVRETLEGRASR